MKPTLLVIKAVFGALGAAVVLESNHPYIAVASLGIAAAANELLMYYETLKK